MNVSRNFVLILLVVFATGMVHGQDHKRQYRSAREFFNEGKYGLAMEAFKPLIVYDKSNSYAEYASFFYALSAYHQRFISVAKDMLLQTKQLYPNWDQMPEVNYWLAKIYFDQRQYFQAMNVLDDYPSLTSQKNVSEMKAHYLKEITDVETMRMMWEEHPQDESVAKALAHAIARQPFLEQDSELLDSLVNRFGFDKSEFATALKPTNVFKDEYVVSLLFPFLASSLEPTTGPKVNQSVLDLYLGMKLALDTLKKQGVNIDLRSYDTERSVEATQVLLEQPELLNTDLLVGPLFQNQTQVIRDFSINNKINMISPVSSNTDFIGENPFGLLFMPSNETIGVKSAEWIAQNIPNRNCMVFFGETPKDTITAKSFLARAQELELNIVYAEKVSVETSADIFNKLATPVEYDEFKNPIEFELKIDSIGSVFVASDDPLIYTKVISAVDTRGDSIIILGNETWLNNAAANFETYERLHLTMTAPTFTRYSDANYKAFRKEFVRTHGVLPTEFSKIGYEFMWFVGHSLKDHGVYFQEGLSEQPARPGFLFKGFDFRSSRSNKYLPFIQFKGGEVVFLDEQPYN
ncbi:MAG: ABC transporter substrate-binding protein, partial [Cyclobacteriaceae bacterium]